MLKALYKVPPGYNLSTGKVDEIAQPPKVGKLVGIRIEKGNFAGIVIVELDDGTKVKAIWDKSLGDQVTMGMKLEIVPTDDPDLWKVIRIVETP
jgi:hypothetical protein